MTNDGTLNFCDAAYWGQYNIVRDCYNAVQNQFPGGYKGKWVIQFSHPADITPAFMIFASMESEFNAFRFVQPYCLTASHQRKVLLN